MIHVLRQYGQVYELRRRETRNLEDALRFRSHGYAYNFLSRFPPDPLNARALRSVLAETHTLQDTHGLTHQELLDALAWDLVSGAITLNARPRRHHEWLSLIITESPPPLPPTSPRPAAARPPVPPPLDTVANAIAQAATLKKAAQKGDPFCEECERAKRRRLQQPEPTNAEAQATILRKAARSGTPFCDAHALKESPPTPVEANAQAQAQAQAAILKKAAQSGTPFCEKCAHALKKSPPTSVETNAAEQAGTLKKAAQSGTPFCAKCERAKESTH